MECDICSRTASSKLPFHCQTCSRSALYEPRLAIARVLLEKEALGTCIEDLVAPRVKQNENSPQKGERPDLALLQAWATETAETRKVQSDAKARDVELHIAALRDEIRIAKEEISQRKARLADRRVEMDSIRNAIPDRRTAITGSIVESIRKGSQSWTGLHNRTTETRAFLCKEAALLYRLRQRKKVIGGLVKDQYTIGGIPIADLREINSKSKIKL